MNPKFTLSSCYSILKRLPSNQKDKSVYLVKSKETGNKFIAKQFFINSAQEYLAFESLLSTLLDLKNSAELFGVLCPMEFHTRNISKDCNELILLYKQTPTSLKDQLKVLGNQVAIDKQRAKEIFLELLKVVYQLHDKHIIVMSL